LAAEALAGRVGPAVPRCARGDGASWTGPLEFECRVLHIPETGQRLIVYCAAPGSPTQAAFRRLARPIPAPAYWAHETTLEGSG